MSRKSYTWQMPKRARLVNSSDWRKLAPGPLSNKNIRQKEEESNGEKTKIAHNERNPRSGTKTDNG